MSIYVLSAALIFGVAIFVCVAALQVPADFRLNVPMSGLLNRRRDRLLADQRLYPGLLRVLRFVVYHTQWVRKTTMGQKLATLLKTRLALAAYPGGLAIPEVIALITLSAMTFGALGAFLGWILSESWNPLLALPFALGGIGLPFIWIEDQERQRVKAVHRALPYVLDLLTLSLGAGMSFMQALSRVVKDRPRGDQMGEELGYVLHEVAMGTTRREALLNLRARLASPYVGELVAAIVQSEQMGAPLSRTLAVQADAIRLRRSQKAETLAGQAPVKMMLPMLFILMAVILTIFGSFIVRAVRGEMF